MKEFEDVIWVAHKLFDKGLVSGSAGNISLRLHDVIYISNSGICFGILDERSFSKISLDGKILEGKPSKEWPMHLKLYQMNEDVEGVIHTHSFYTTLVSCMKDLDLKWKELFDYTPYLNMQTGGRIGLVDYEKPGSKELFDQFNRAADEYTHTYILKHHGLLVGAKEILKAFYILEELEQTCKLYCKIHDIECDKIESFMIE